MPPRYAIMAGLTEVERELLWRTARIRTIEYKEATRACAADSRVSRAGGGQQR